MKKAIKFFIDDLRTDWQFIKKCAKNIKEEKPMIEPEKMKKVKEAFISKEYWVGVFKQYWLIFIMFALFWIAGYWWGMQRCSEVCNGYIVKTFYNTTQLFHL